MKPRISMVALGVKDLAASQKFYEEGLGLPKVDGPPGVAFFDLNGTWLGLSPMDDQAKDIGVSVQASGYAGINLVHNVASEAEVDRVVEDAKKAGASVIKPPIRADWGGYHGYFADPDGHIWEVAHNPYVWIGPSDE